MAMERPVFSLRAVNASKTRGETGRAHARPPDNFQRLSRLVYGNVDG